MDALPHQERMTTHPWPPRAALLSILLTLTLLTGCLQAPKGLPIVLIGRDNASGTRDFFKTTVIGTDNFSKYLLDKNSNGAIQLTVAQTPGAIGYVGLGFTDQTVKVVPINNVTPTIETILADTYPISRNLYMFTKGNATGPAAEYLRYLQSTDGQTTVAQEGFIPIQNTTPYHKNTTDLKGTIRISGSTTVLPIAEQTVAQFMTLYPHVQITVSAGGSGAGITAVSTGTVTIGMASRELKPSEQHLGLIEYTIGKDGIAVIVNPTNTYVTGLTLNQLKAIYEGQITNWDQLTT